MDAALARLERAWRDDPEDAARAGELALACLRAGRIPLALVVARAGRVTELQEQAARGLAELEGDGLEFARIEDGFERFSLNRRELVLIPGGAFLEDGASPSRSLMEPGGARSTYRRVVLPDYLIAIETSCVGQLDFVRTNLESEGGRLPTRGEWKKSWRGGTHLHGDGSQTRINREPDALAPPVDHGRRSVYGCRFHPTGSSSAALGEWASAESTSDLAVICFLGGPRYYSPQGDPPRSFVQAEARLTRDIQNRYVPRPT